MRKKIWINRLESWDRNWGSPRTNAKSAKSLLGIGQRSEWDCRENRPLRDRVGGTMLHHQATAFWKEADRKVVARTRESDSFEKGVGAGDLAIENKSRTDNAVRWRLWNYAKGMRKMTVLPFQFADEIRRCYSMTFLLISPKDACRWLPALMVEGGLNFSANYGRGSIQPLLHPYFMMLTYVLRIKMNLSSEISTATRILLTFSSESDKFRCDGKERNTWAKLDEMRWEKEDKMIWDGKKRTIIIIVFDQDN